MLKKMIPERYVCGLDVGARRIKAAILHNKSSQDIDVAGVYETTTHAFRNHSVTDLGEFSESIHATLGDLSQKSGIKIKDVCLSVGGNFIEAREAISALPLVDRGSKVISSRDVQKLNRQARLLGVKIEEEVLHDLPQTYQVDDVNTVINPLGLYGRKLAVRSLIVIAQLNRLKNIIKAVNQAGYGVSRVYFSSYVASQATLTKEDMVKGCALIDFGSQATNVLVFQDEILVDMSSIPGGGDAFSQSIAQELSLPFDLAEEIKKSYAVAVGTDLYPNEEILVKRESQYIPIKRENIFQAIEPVTNTIVQGVKQALDQSGFQHVIHNGIVLIGGGSLMPGILERLQDETGMPVRLGKLALPVQKNLSQAALYLPAIGAAMTGIRQSFGYHFSNNGKEKGWKGWSGKLKELYQEYF